MPSKLLTTAQTSTLVQERSRILGLCVKAQRLAQKMKARELCNRVGMSDATLRRIEQGDPAVGIGLFLSALLVLGMLDDAVPAPAQALWAPGSRQRVSSPRTGSDDDF